MKLLTINLYKMKFHIILLIIQLKVIRMKCDNNDVNIQPLTSERTLNVIDILNQTNVNHYDKLLNIDDDVISDDIIRTTNEPNSPYDIHNNPLIINVEPTLAPSSASLSLSRISTTISSKSSLSSISQRVYNRQLVDYNRTKSMNEIRVHPTWHNQRFRRHETQSQQNIVQQSTTTNAMSLKTIQSNDTSTSSPIIVNNNTTFLFLNESYEINCSQNNCTISDIIGPNDFSALARLFPYLFDANDTCIADQKQCDEAITLYKWHVYEYIYPTLTEWIFIISHTIVFSIGLVGNALVCIAVYTNYTMRTVTNIFIVNLAIADFFVILFCLPPSVIWDVTETWFFGDSLCKVVQSFQHISITVSVLTLAFISLDRWYAICFPLKYVSRNSRAIGAIAFIWVIAVVSSIPEFLSYGLRKTEIVRFGIQLFTQCSANWGNEVDKNVWLAKFMALYVLPLSLMSIAYFKIIRVLWTQDTIPGHRETRSQQYTPVSNYVANSSAIGQLKARRKAAKMLVAVVIMFACCYFPIYLLNILRFSINIDAGHVSTFFSLFSHWLCYANSAVNPVIYNFMSGKFRREFKKSLDRCRCGQSKFIEPSCCHGTPANRINNISSSTRSNYQLTSLRDTHYLRDISRQTVQTSFIDSVTPMLNTNDNHTPAKNLILDTVQTTPTVNDKNT